MTAFVEESSSISDGRCLILYWFKNADEHPVKIRSHGNAKSKDESFCQMSPFVGHIQARY
jgi:hypothetical protein